MRSSILGLDHITSLVKVTLITTIPSRVEVHRKASLLVSIDSWHMLQFTCRLFQVEVSRLGDVLLHVDTSRVPDGSRCAFYFQTVACFTRLSDGKCRGGQGVDWPVAVG